MNNKMSHDNLHEPSPTQTREVEDLKGHLEIEERGAILIVRVDGGPHALFGPEIANQLDELVERVDHDPNRPRRRHHWGASQAVHQPC